MIEIETKSAVNAAERSVVVPNFENIEAVGLPELCKHWCVWKIDGPHKKPGNGRHGISSQRPEQWVSYSEAKTAYFSGGWDGIGLLPSAENGILGLDADKVFDAIGGDVEFMAGDIVDSLTSIGCFVEYSPGGRGLHGFVLAVKPDGCKAKAEFNGHSVEAYQRSHTHKDNYLTVTGVPYGAAGVVALPEAQAKVERYLKAVGLMPRDEVHGGGSVQEKRPSLSGKNRLTPKGSGKWPMVGNSGFEGMYPNYRERTDVEIEKLVYSDKYDKAGEYKAIRETGGKSEERCKLISHIGYFTRDAEQIARLVRKCPFDHEKLNEARNGYEDFLDYDICRLIGEKERNYDEEVVEGKAAAAAGMRHTEAMYAESSSYIVGGIADLLAGRKKLQPDLHTLAELLIRDSRLLGGVFYDEFGMMNRKTVSFRQLLNDKYAPASAGLIEDNDLLALSSWFKRQWDLSVSNSDMLRKVTSRWGGCAARNPVKERLEELRDNYDGVERLESMFVRYFGVEAVGRQEAYYLAEIGKRFMIGVVARTLNPGRKQDHMLILENPNGGEGKSFSVRILAEAIGPDCFLDSYSPENNADSLRLMRGMVLGEWGELSGFNKKESEEIKNFLTRGADPYRDPYAMMHRHWPRTISFIATSNQLRYLTDLGGRRRYWPIRVGRIDLDALRKDAPMLWAEAVRRYEAGERYWVDTRLDSALAAACDTQQMRRLVDTSFDDIAEQLALEVATSGECWRVFSRDEMGELIVTKKGLLPPITNGDWRSQVVLALKRAGWTNAVDMPNGNAGWSLTPDKVEAVWRGRELGPPPPMPKKGRNKIADARAKAYAKEVQRLLAEEEAEKAGAA